MAEKTSIDVRIYGNDYTLVGTESEEYIQKVCFFVDKRMRETAKGNNNLSTASIAILSAVNIADEYHKNKALLDETLSDLKKYKEEAFSLKNQNVGLKKENEFLKEEIQSLKIELAKHGKL